MSGAPDIWEPWVPREGQRVRIVLRGECAFNGPAGLSALGHRAWEDGLVGTVVRVMEDLPYPDGPVARGHRFFVRYDEWWSAAWRSDTPGLRFDSGAWAASELEPA